MVTGITTKSFFEAANQEEIDAMIHAASERIRAGRVKELSTEGQKAQALAILQRVCKGLLVIRVNPDLDANPSQAIDSAAVNLDAPDRHRLTCNWAAQELANIMNA